MPSENGADAMVRELLRDFGLEDLTDELLRWIREGLDPGSDEFYQRLRATERYQQRFRANEERRAAGLTVLSERQILDFENTARSMLRANGLPQGFYDDPDDFVTLLVNDVSPAELQTRIEDGYVRVAQHPEIRAVYGEWFGANGDSALAATFLDPQKALPLLEKEVAAAELGGVGRVFGFNVQQGDAFATATTAGPMSRDALNSGFQRLAQVRGLFQETLSERGDDLVAEREGLGFAFDVGDAERVRGRVRQRLADLSGGTGRVASGQRGMIGTGSAR
jgi:hypothetical protein